MADRVVREDVFGNIKYVAGADIGFEDNNQITRAAVAVLELPHLNEVETAVVRQPTRFPYVPGLLSFREVPAVLDALEALHRQPDLILCDGQGYAHPRRFGLACHLGVLANSPTIGVGKTRLIGSYREPADVRGAWEPLIDDDETIGAVVRSRAGTRPIFVSIGHRISLATAITYVMRCTGRYRLPETTRRAHRLASGA